MSHPLEPHLKPQLRATSDESGLKTFISANEHHSSNQEQHFQTYNKRDPYFKVSYGGRDSGVENVVHNNSYRDNNDNSPIPLPDWPVALSTWGPSWWIHVYGFSVLYLVLTGLCVAIFVRFRLRVKRLKIVYNTLILMAIAGMFRAVFMLVDPYGYKGRMVGLMVGIMTQAVYPLFCACYGLTQVMLLRITNVNVGRSRLRTLSCLMGCTLTYLFVVVIIETLVFYERSAKLLLLVDSGCFIVWSLSLGITFICSGFRLTQYASETKKAHKELNAFCIHRRSASNTTWLSVISNAISDTSATSPDAQTLSRTASPTASYSVHGDTSLLSSPTFVAPAPHYPTTTSSHQPRLSRPKLKICNQNRMTVTIATDDDDQSTSSTDADGSRSESARKPISRTRKNAKKKHSKSRRRSRSKSTASSPIYRAVSATDDTCNLVKYHPRTKKQPGGNSDTISNTVFDSSEPLSITRTHDSNSESPAKMDSSSTKMDDSYTTMVDSPTQMDDSSTQMVDSLTNLDDSSTNAIYPLSMINDPVAKSDESLSTHLVPTQTHLQNTAASSSLLQSQPTTSSLSPSQHPQQIGNIYKNGKTEIGDKHQDTEPSPNNKSSDSPSFKLNHQHNPSSPISSKFENSQSDTHPHADKPGCDAYALTNEPLLDSKLELPEFSPAIDNTCSSIRENGYLADTEHTCMTSAFSRLSNSLRRKKNQGSNVSPQRSSSCDSIDSTTSPVLPDRMPPNTPASLGLFRIRQSGMVQRAVHLTYLLTFLFMFACLLQLYTVFGVYGVLGSTRKPDPWPWLIFHTIFRATEVSIGLTITSIAFITLNYRHQRARRRYQQQQQHLNATTRDCIV